MDVPISILDFHHVYAALVAALGKQVAFDEMLRERVRTILEYANDAVISIDSAGIVTQWNRTSESLFGWTSNEAMGRNIVDLIVPPAFRSSFVNILTHLGRFGKNSTTARRELLAIDRYGKELSVEVSLNVNNVAGQFEFTAFLHDISERKKWESTLIEMALSDGLTGLPNRRHFM